MLARTIYTIVRFFVKQYHKVVFACDALHQVHYQLVVVVGKVYIFKDRRQFELIVSSGGIIIAEIGKRGKAFKELDPYAGRRAEAITITAKTGDYGDYFRISMKFKSMVVTV